jgi:hypothetical protein
MRETLLDFYLTAWWQLYLGCLVVGLASAVSVCVWVRDRCVLGWYGFFLRFLLYFAAASALSAAGLAVTQHNDSIWAGICLMNMRLAWFFVDGALLGSLAASAVLMRGSTFRDNELPGILLLPQTVCAAQVSVASQYVSAGLSKFLGRETLEFFHMSGYGTAFFFFIPAWESFWGIGMLSRSAAILSVVALSFDMFGAIYTHYHNYFSRGFSGPFANSLDGLRMLLLMAYVGFALARQRPHHVKR